MARKKIVAPSDFELHILGTLWEHGPATVRQVMDRLVETYYGPRVDFHTRPAVNRDLDIVREFAERCRVELRGG